MYQNPLRKLPSESLHLEAIKAADHCKMAEAHLIQIIDEVNEREFYLECGVTSLYQYCTRLLHLSESISYSLIAVIRKSKEVPELMKAVENGEVTLSKAKKICSVITPKSSKEWIDLAKYETSRIIEKCVAQANPKEAINESLQYRSVDRLELKLGVSEEWATLLAEIKDLVSQKDSSAASTEEALFYVMREFKQRHHPVWKAERAMARAKRKTAKNSQDTVQIAAPNEQFPGTVAQGLRRKPLKRITIHKVALRDRNQCTYETKLGRCNEKRWLDLHHIVPIAKGGSDDPSNLTTLCHAHHKIQHRSLELTYSESLL